MEYVGDYTTNITSNLQVMGFDSAESNVPTVDPTNYYSYRQLQKPTEQPAELTAHNIDQLLDIATMFTVDQVENQHIEKSGNSTRSILKDLYRQVVKKIILKLLKEVAQVEVDFAGFVDLDQNGQQFDRELRSILKQVSPRQQNEFVSQLLRVIEQWPQLVDAVKDNTTISPELMTYVPIVHEMQEYFRNHQLRTKLGEEMVFARDKLNLNENEANLLASLVQEKNVRQRIFEYTLPDRDLPGMIVNARGYANQRHNDVRELIEMQNLQTLQQASKTTQIGEIIMEVSPPIHNWQQDVMWRFFTRTSYLNDENELVTGWQVQILSLPYARTTPAVDGYFDIDKVLQAQAELQTHGEQLPTIMSSAVVSTLGAENRTLAQLTKFPPQPIMDLISRISVVKDELGGVETLAAVDKIVAQNVDSTLEDLAPITDSIFREITQVTQPQWLDDSTRKLKHSIAASRLKYIPDEQLSKLTDEQKAKLAESDLVDEVVNNNLNLDHFISELTDGGTLELGSECGETILGESEYEVINYSSEDVDQMEISHIDIGRDGTKLTWRVKGVDPETGEKQYILDNCPMCGYRGLDPCANSCPKCDMSTNKMRMLYEQGKLQDYKESVKQWNPRTEQYETPSNTSGTSRIASARVSNYASTSDQPGLFADILGSIFGGFGFLINWMFPTVEN